MNYLEKMLKDRGYVVKIDSTHFMKENGVHSISTHSISTHSISTHSISTHSISTHSFRDFVTPLGIDHNTLLGRSDIKKLVVDFLIHSYRDEATDSILIVPEHILEEAKICAHGSVEVISELTLEYDLTENINVSSHSLCSPENQDYPSNPDCLPVLNINDPVSLWYGFRIGDVVRIYRDYCDETYYRIVSSK